VKEHHIAPLRGASGKQHFSSKKLLIPDLLCRINPKEGNPRKQESILIMQVRHEEGHPRTIE